VLPVLEKRMIFIAGGTGFVGRNLLRSFEGEGLPIRCLVRDAGKGEWVRSLGFETVSGDITDEDSLRGVMDGVKTVVHLVGIIEEKPGRSFQDVHVRGTENLVNEAIAAGVGNFFYQSALGADPGSSSSYLNTKARAERVVISANIPYTIFRPSLIVGPGDGFTERMKQLLSAGPVVPVPGDGNSRFQPLYIEDWIRCFSAFLEGGGLENRVLEIGGPEQLTYNEILTAMMKALKIAKPVVHLPMGLLRTSLPFQGVLRSFAELFGREIPAVTGELLSLLSRDNLCEIDSIEKHFNFSPLPFTEAVKKFL